LTLAWSVTDRARTKNTQSQLLEPQTNKAYSGNCGNKPNDIAQTVGNPAKTTNGWVLVHIVEKWRAIMNHGPQKNLDNETAEQYNLKTPERARKGE
jgi:hypothetical protein